MWSTIFHLICGYGGIGRRAGFRCQSGFLGAGSSPVIRTKILVQKLCGDFYIAILGFYVIIELTKDKHRSTSAYAQVIGYTARQYVR